MTQLDPADALAALLVRKARADERLIEVAQRELSIDEEIVGFHAQQAVEKLLKALLAKHRIPYRRTHDIEELADLLDQRGYALPTSFGDLSDLNPFAVDYRYDEWTEVDAPLDRQGVLAFVRSLRAWVEQQLPPVPRAGDEQQTTP